MIFGRRKSDKKPVSQEELQAKVLGKEITEDGEVYYADQYGLGARNSDRIPKKLSRDISDLTGIAEVVGNVFTDNNQAKLKKIRATKGDISDPDEELVITPIREKKGKPSGFMSIFRRK